MTREPSPSSRRPARALRRAGPAAVAALAAVPIAVVPAGAGDQSITGSLRQTFLYDTNTQLDQDGEETFGSITRLGLRYANRTPTASLSLSTGFSLSAFSEENDDNLDGLFPSLSGAYTVRRPTQTLSVSFSGSLRPVDFFADTGLDLDPFRDDDPDAPDEDEDEEDGEDTGEEAPDAGDADLPETTRREDETLRLILSAGLNFTERLTPSASRSFGLSASRRDFLENEDDELTPSTSLSASAGFNQQITARASWGLSGGASLFVAEDEENRVTFTLRATPSLSYARTPKESYSVSLGPSLSITSRDEVTGFLLGPDGLTPVRETTTEVSPGVNGGASFSYTDRVTTVSASLTQGVAPDDEGVAVNRTGLTASVARRLSATDRLSARLGLSYRTALYGEEDAAFDDTVAVFSSAGWSHDLNSRNTASLRATARYTDDENDDEGETVLGLGASWSYRILADTRANLGYDFRWEDGTGDSLTSHRVSLTLSHGFTLLP